jgi:hypothetical protein
MIVHKTATSSDLPQQIGIEYRDMRAVYRATRHQYKERICAIRIILRRTGRSTRLSVW